MGDSATAMRDPAFYRWHTSINDMFDAYKQTLTPYTEEQVSSVVLAATSILFSSDAVSCLRAFKASIYSFHSWISAEFKLRT